MTARQCGRTREPEVTGGRRRAAQVEGGSEEEGERGRGLGVGGRHDLWIPTTQVVTQPQPQPQQQPQPQPQQQPGCGRAAQVEEGGSLGFGTSTFPNLSSKSLSIKSTSMYCLGI